MMNRFVRSLVFSIAAMSFWAGLNPCNASDHADPLIVRFLGRPESNLTGLFAFEANEKLVVALCVRPGLADKFVDLKPLTLDIHLDIDSKISFHKGQTEDEGRTFRYGGWIQDPKSISEDITFRFRFDQFKNNPFEKVKFGNSIKISPLITTPFDNDAEKRKAFQKDIRTWVGVRDDPFILHGFSTTNVVAMVVEIPFEYLGENRELLIWGTSRRYGKQIDHVGRSLRTMLPRFDFLNTLHPRDHAKAIRKRHEETGVIQDVMRYVGAPIFGIRHYDFEPDVMIFSQTRWHQKLGAAEKKLNDVKINDYELVSFPNGRRLTDDVAVLMCERGDCLLYEVSTADAHADHKVHPTKNGRDHLEEFPYLAPPNENPVEPETPRLRWRTIIILGLIGFGLLLFFALPWFLYWRVKKKLRRLEAAMDPL